eukprot:TRINITY_DN11978_c0_g1_i1.p1 TRINITY_DN11978_c0_g1~~TRINITY_DN11978_c0_g1_i1.p1  ORF type:complete len:284 (+),score=88.27 TRINITY_DN11978_c0_g1_i1:116-967(+)
MSEKAPKLRSNYVSDKYTNKQRCLVLSSRGMAAIFSRLMDDIRSLLPHQKKEVKFDCRGYLQAVGEIAEVKECTSVMFFECRNKKDNYLWMSHVPNGPSIKFLIKNIHTMDDLKLSGNCLKGSRPILHFSSEFDESLHMKVVKETFVKMFGTPRCHPKSKPFVDHVMSFYYVNGTIMVRHFQIVEETEDKAEEKMMIKKGEEPTNLMEIGPRFSMEIVRIFAGSFGGKTIYANPEYVSPNTKRQDVKLEKAAGYIKRVEARKAQEERKSKIVLPVDPLDDVWG